MEQFDLTKEDEYAVDVAISAAYLFLNKQRLSAQKIIGLGHALYALERLPIPTKGAFCEFGLFYRHGDKEFSESKYIDFRINEYKFEISIGGSTYNRSVGSDSFSDPGWLVERNGIALRDADIYNLSGKINEYLNLGAEVTLTDESDIEIEYE